MKRFLLVALTLVLCLSVFAAPALGAARLSSAQKANIERVLDYYMDQNINFYPEPGEVYGTGFDAAKPSDSTMIDMAVLVLYYPDAFVKSESWMKPEVKENYDHIFTSAQVERMCQQLFGVKPAKHGDTVWGYAAGKYSITGDRGEAVAPKTASYKALKNGDFQLTLNYRSYNEKGKIYNTGLKVIATVRPADTLWGFTIQSIAFTGKIKIK